MAFGALGAAFSALGAFRDEATSNWVLPSGDRVDEADCWQVRTLVLLVGSNGVIGRLQWYYW
jgi:hypothetical protein